MLQQTTVAGREPGPHLLVLGGVHGDEFEPMRAARRLIKELDPATLRGRVTVVPVVNEAAFARGQRTGDDQQDLARACPGREDGSPTERLAFALSALIRTADYLIDMHTAGSRYRILPLAGYTLHPNPRVLDLQRQMARAFNLPIVWGTNPRFNGTTLSVARDAEIPAIYVENGGEATYDRGRVRQNVEGCLRVACVLGMLDVPTPPNQVRYVVEDDRDHSGHLQRQHPAPRAGFFERAVELGDVVAPGQVIGRVVDPLGQDAVEAAAAHEGTVLFLRVFPSVQQGDCLASLLPVTAPGEYVFPREDR